MTGLCWGRFLLLAVVGLLMLAAPAHAEEPVPFPLIPKAKAGTQCVEDPDFMRRNHMDLLQHQRDDTLRRGVRGGDHALAECISCHSVRDDAGQVVTVENDQHFCVACHKFAAVQPDCFQCHTSVPGEDGEQTALKKGEDSR